MWNKLLTGLLFLTALTSAYAGSPPATVNTLLGAGPTTPVASMLSSPLSKTDLDKRVTIIAGTANSPITDDYYAFYAQGTSPTAAYRVPIGTQSLYCPTMSFQGSIASYINLGSSSTLPANATAAEPTGGKPFASSNVSSAGIYFPSPSTTAWTQLDHFTKFQSGEWPYVRSSTSVSNVFQLKLDCILL